VLQVNGTPVHSLAHLAQTITAASNSSTASPAGSPSSSPSASSPGASYVRLDLEWSKVVVLGAASAAAATARILRQNNIPTAASEGLLEQVGAGAGGAGGRRCWTACRAAALLAACLPS
jgi:hypothetical protein